MSTASRDGQRWDNRLFERCRGDFVEPQHDGGGLAREIDGDENAQEGSAKAAASGNGTTLPSKASCRASHPLGRTGLDLQPVQRRAMLGATRATTIPIGGTTPNRPDPRQ